MGPGHERWHPSPVFYYQRGGGPMLDMGPYYITDLVNLLGPVKSVVGSATKTRAQRPILSEPLRGQTIDVEVPTHITGLMEFVSGAVVQITTSFDVPGHRHLPIEVYGTDATLIVPDPNRFQGEVRMLPTGGKWTYVTAAMPYADANYRSIGLADMAHALRSGRPHRASGDLALHVLEVIEAFGVSSNEGRKITIETTTERPAPLSDDIVGRAIGLTTGSGQRIKGILSCAKH